MRAESITEQALQNVAMIGHTLRKAAPDNGLPERASNYELGEV